MKLTKEQNRQSNIALAWFILVVLSVFGIAAIAAYCGLLKLVWI